MWISLSLFAKSRGEAGGDASRLRAFFALNSLALNSLALNSLALNSLALNNFTLSRGSVVALLFPGFVGTGFRVSKLFSRGCLHANLHDGVSFTNWFCRSYNCFCCHLHGGFCCNFCNNCGWSDNLFHHGGRFGNQLRFGIGSNISHAQTCQRVIEGNGVFYRAICRLGNGLGKLLNSVFLGSVFLGFHRSVFFQGSFLG